jgi:hypothetical protein
MLRPLARKASREAMSTHLQLPEKWAPRLLAQPETGMGYQTAAITLRDGSVIEDALIVGGTITEIRGYDTIPFSAGEISDITVTHRKWAFRR